MEMQTVRQQPDRVRLEIEKTLDLLIRQLADNPDKVKISTMVGEQTTVFEVRVEKADRGKVIGKQGQTASALRQLLKAMSAKNQIRAILEICD